MAGSCPLEGLERLRSVFLDLAFATKVGRPSQAPVRQANAPVRGVLARGKAAIGAT